MLLALLLLVHSASSNLNLFLSTQEMKRLIGLKKELFYFYVREVTINKYVMGFVIPIPSSVTSLHFTWYSHTHNVGLSLQYSLRTSLSHPKARSGLVLEVPQIWQI